MYRPGNRYRSCRVDGCNESRNFFKVGESVRRFNLSIGGFWKRNEYTVRKHRFRCLSSPIYIKRKLSISPVAVTSAGRSKKKKLRYYASGRFKKRGVFQSDICLEFPLNDSKRIIRKIIDCEHSPIISLSGGYSAGNTYLAKRLFCKIPNSVYIPYCPEEFAENYLEKIKLYLPGKKPSKTTLVIDGNRLAFLHYREKGFKKIIFFETDAHRRDSEMHEAFELKRKFKGEKNGPSSHPFSNYIFHKDKDSIKEIYLGSLYHASPSGSIRTGIYPLFANNETAECKDQFICTFDTSLIATDGPLKFSTKNPKTKGDHNYRKDIDYDNFSPSSDNMKLVILLESPHVDEFPSFDDSPRGPAWGETGQNISKLLCTLLHNSGCASWFPRQTQKIDLYFVNAIRYQTSLGISSINRQLRDSIFYELWTSGGQEDLRSRLEIINPDVLINCCTKTLKKKCVNKAFFDFLSQSYCILESSHPCRWKNGTKISKMK